MWLEDLKLIFSLSMELYWGLQFGVEDPALFPEKQSYLDN
jgi:hypothetical protein